MDDFDKERSGRRATGPLSNSLSTDELPPPPPPRQPPPPISLLPICPWLALRFSVSLNLRMGNGRVRTDDTVGDEGFPGCLCGAVGGYDMFCRSPPRHLRGIPTNERIVRLACAANGRGAFEGMAGVKDMKGRGEGRGVIR